MSNIPAEYSNVDFGFSAIDDVPIGSTTTETTSPAIDENDVTRVVLNALSPIEDKIDRLLAIKNAMDDDNVEIAIAQKQEEVAGKVIELEKLIMPLLVNLLKTSDKEYIRWPDRGPKVQAMIDQVLAITRS
jgi:hypothetical protein